MIESEASVKPESDTNQSFLLELQNRGYLDEADRMRVALASEQTLTPLEHVVLELGLVEEEPLFRALASHHDVPFVDLSEIDAANLDLSALPHEFLERVGMLPVDCSADPVVIAVSNLDCEDVLQSIEFFLGKPTVAHLAMPSAIRAVLTRNKRNSDQDDLGQQASQLDVDRLAAQANDGPIIKRVNDMIARGTTLGASDLHIEARGYGARVRYRIDGMLRNDIRLSEADRAPIVSRIKIMSGLNISEHRRPQDGRADQSIRGKQIDLRVSTLPTQFGESVVIRLLDKTSLRLDWDALGFDKDLATELETLVSMPNGIFLVAGPTGSGKTTTLYTVLSTLNTEDRKIVTVEDPIEYSLPGVNQTQVDTAIDMDFATALRAILRQDPDVILLGEIRDRETAEIAVRAALVGRLVLSTVHTNSSVEAVDRLVDLGAPPYLLSATLRGVLSQRLARKVCSRCSGNDPQCEHCSGNGYLGRVAIPELLEITPELSDAIAENRPSRELEEIAVSAGFLTMHDNARGMLAAGIIDELEVARSLGAGRKSSESTSNAV